MKLVIGWSIDQPCRLMKRVVGSIPGPYRFPTDSVFTKNLFQCTQRRKLNWEKISLYWAAKVNDTNTVGSRRWLTFLPTAILRMSQNFGSVILPTANRRIWLNFFFRSDRRRPESRDQLSEGGGRPVARDDGDAQTVLGKGLPRRQQQRRHLSISVRRSLPPYLSFILGVWRTSFSSKKPTTSFYHASPRSYLL